MDIHLLGRRGRGPTLSIPGQGMSTQLLLNKESFTRVISLMALRVTAPSVGPLRARLQRYHGH